MALSAGTRLGPYEILTPLGAGGMGEVYRASDTRLDRTVAIKVLPPHTAGNPEARQRFEREARAVSSLNHPHICTLYDVGCQDGLDYLVMEYLEGESLAARLAGGALPVDQALRHAVQIAEALGDAHRHGVFHRDLKPGNIMLTRTGAKLMDFGLAKMHAAGPDGLGLTTLPTQADTLTQAGAVLGTVQYMAPEQLEGKEANARSDIFAFGSVLYEMVAGRRPFTGQTLAKVMAAILEQEPPPLPGSCGPALDRVRKRCPAKDPDERWQSAQDLASELKWLAEGGSQLTASVTAPAPKSSRAWMAVAVVLALALAGLAVVHFRGAPPPEQTIRFQVPAPEKETILEVALSPDGQRLVFATGPPNSSGPDRRLWVRSLDSLSPQPLSGTEGALLPFWSPDSRAIAFFAGRKLKKIDLLGGPAQILCDAPDGRPGAWNREGVILFRPSEGPLYRVSAAGGEARPVTTLDASRQETQHTWVQFLPDGHHFLYTAVSSVAENSAIHAASLDSKETKRLFTSTGKAAYTQDDKGHGYVVFLRADTLLAQRFDAARLELQGEPFPVAENVSASSEGSGSANASGWSVFSASDAGTLASRRGTGTAIKELVWFDRAGRRLNTVGEPADYSNPTLSPDEKRLAISRVDPQTKTRDIWIFDVERGTSSRLTFDRADEMNPMWSPDGKRIAFTSTRKGQRDLYVKDASGSGEEQVLLVSNEAKNAENWSPDGRYLLFAGSGRTMALPLEGDGKPLPLLTGPYTRGQAQVSPDGRWLAYRSNESGRFEVYVQSFPELLAGRSAGKWQVSTAGGSYPQWRRDGQELFYLAPDNKLSTVSVKTGGTAFERDIPNTLFEVRVEAALRNTHFVPAANGQRFLVLQVPDQRASSPIDVVVNWAAGAQR